MRRLLAALALAAASASVPANAATWTLAPGDSLPQALQRAADGDRIELLPGDYRGEVAVITQRQLTLRGLPGDGGRRAVLHADGNAAEGKAILVVRGGDVRVENLEFRGARVPERNGAGIRFERGHLVLRRCVFADNEKSILTSNVGDAELEVRDSMFSAAPPDSQLPHLIYVGSIARFTLIGSSVSGGDHGHLVKSRARENFIFANRLVDGPGGRAAYELEFPNGGLAWVVGNVIGQSAGTTNPALVSFGAEGVPDARALGLFMAHNTLINAGAPQAIFVHLHALPRTPELRFVNNLVVGPGAVEPALADAAQGNFILPDTTLLAQASFELRADAPMRGRALPQPGRAQGVSLQPQMVFAPPLGTRALRWPARPSPGADP